MTGKRLFMYMLEPDKEWKILYAQFVDHQDSYWEVLEGYELDFEMGWLAAQADQSGKAPEYRVVKHLSEPE
jgi:hypothetical protein